MEVHEKSRSATFNVLHLPAIEANTSLSISSAMGATEAIESETNAIATARQQMRMNNPRPSSSLGFQGKNRNGPASGRGCRVLGHGFFADQQPRQIDDIILSTFASSLSMTGLVPSSGPF
jgi:hypothetical protein